MLYFFKCIAEEQRVGCLNTSFPSTFIMHPLKILLMSLINPTYTVGYSSEVYDKKNCDKTFTIFFFNVK